MGVMQDFAHDGRFVGLDRALVGRAFLGVVVRGVAGGMFLLEGRFDAFFSCFGPFYEVAAFFLAVYFDRTRWYSVAFFFVVLACVTVFSSDLVIFRRVDDWDYVADVWYVRDIDLRLVVVDGRELICCVGGWSGVF